MAPGLFRGVRYDRIGRDDGFGGRARLWRWRRWWLASGRNQCQRDAERREPPPSRGIRECQGDIHRAMILARVARINCLRLS
jgi:hypothetical protein